MDVLTIFLEGRCRSGDVENEVGNLVTFLQFQLRLNQSSVPTAVPESKNLPTTTVYFILSPMMFYSYSEIKMKKSTTKNQDSRLHKFKIYDEVIKFSTCTSHSCFAVNSYKTLSLVPRSKKSGPDSVSRYCKALFRGINVALFALPDTPRCKETCSDIIFFASDFQNRNKN